MNDTRFTFETSSTPEQVPAGFLLLPVGAYANGQGTTIQQVYQQLYQQAVQTTQRSRLPELFANMN